MSRSHFEQLVETEMSKCKDAAIGVTLGDSHKHAEIVGMHKGLGRALEMYRQAVRTDADDEHMK